MSDSSFLVSFYTYQCRNFPALDDTGPQSLDKKSIASTKPLNKFEKTKLTFYFNNNDLRKSVGYPEHDRLHKIRPVIQQRNERCQ